MPHTSSTLQSQMSNWHWDQSVPLWLIRFHCAHNNVPVRKFTAHVFQKTKVKQFSSVFLPPSFKCGWWTLECRHTGVCTNVDCSSSKSNTQVTMQVDGAVAAPASTATRSPLDDLLVNCVNAAQNVEYNLQNDQNFLELFEVTYSTTSSINYVLDRPQFIKQQLVNLPDTLLEQYDRMSISFSLWYVMFIVCNESLHCHKSAYIYLLHVHVFFLIVPHQNCKWRALWASSPLSTELGLQSTISCSFGIIIKSMLSRARVPPRMRPLPHTHVESMFLYSVLFIYFFMSFMILISWVAYCLKHAHDTHILPHKHTDTDTDTDTDTETPLHIIIDEFTH